MIMKKILIILTCLILLLAFASCEKEKEPEIVTVVNVGNAENPDDTQPKDVVPYHFDENTKTNIAYVNWTGDNSIYVRGLNSVYLAVSSVQYLPIYKAETKAELDSFVSDFKDLLEFDREYDGYPSFNDIIADCDEKFFEDKFIVMVYVTAGSGSFRFAIDDVLYENGSMTVSVKQINNPEAYTDDMAGWIAVAELNKADFEDCTLYYAFLHRDYTEPTPVKNFPE